MRRFVYGWRLFHDALRHGALSARRARQAFSMKGRACARREEGMDIGTVGIWAFLDMLPARQAQEAAAEIEGLGFKALWIPEAIGREIFTSSALLLAGTARLVVATGIANIWARDAMAMANAQRTLTEAYPDRFLLGMGVSHAPLVDGVRGHEYAKPLSYMRSYLDA